MTFVKGQKRPEGAGRKPGQVSKRTLMLREFLESHNFNLVEQILARLPQLDAKEQVLAMLRLMPYVYPRLSQIAVSSLSPEEEQARAMSDDEIYQHVKDIILLEERTPDGTAGTAESRLFETSEPPRTDQSAPGPARDGGGPDQKADRRARSRSSAAPRKPKSGGKK